MYIVQRHVSIPKCSFGAKLVFRLVEDVFRDCAGMMLMYHVCCAPAFVVGARCSVKDGRCCLYVCVAPSLLGAAEVCEAPEDSFVI